MTAAGRFDFSRRAQLADDGGRPLDAILVTTAEVAAAVHEAVAQGYAVMPAGGLTSAINSFDYDHSGLAGRFADVVAVRPKGTVMPEIVSADTALERLLSHQMAIDTVRATVSIGAGLTFGQVNTVLGHMLGSTAKVLVDLTSAGSASVGGVVATGGMGPLRLHPSATLEAICLADGAPEPRLVSGEAIGEHEGMQGWTGMVTAARMRWFEVPPCEFGLVLPIQGSDADAMADLLTYLHPWTDIALPADGNLLQAGDGGATLINGIELIGRAALEQFVAHAADPALSKAQGLLQACDYAGADMLVCLTGWSDSPVEEVLGVLLDENETIGGVGIDYGVGFSSDSEMDVFRAIREGAPDLARTQARIVPAGKLKPWTASTDVNVALPRDTAATAAVLSAYLDYRESVAAMTGRFPGVEITLSAYGHLSPRGLDPHHRVTAIAEAGREDSLAAARSALAEEKKRLIRNLVGAALRTGCAVTGGEKGMPSVLDILRAFGDAAAPPNLLARRERARAALADAPAAFSFRAPRELVGA